MIVVYIKHFLNEEGRKFFNKWHEDTRKILEKQNGFISLRLLKPVQADFACHLLLEFENLDLLNSWSRSEAHKKAVSRLDAYKVKELESYVFAVS